MKIVAVQSGEAGAWKERLAWHFEQFSKDRVLSSETLWEDIEGKQRQLFVVMDDDIKAAVLTRIADDDSQSCVVTHASGYDRVSWQHLWVALETWARGIGCKRIEAVARPGWEKVLNQFGMKKTHVILERDL